MPQSFLIIQAQLIERSSARLPPVVRLGGSSFSLVARLVDDDSPYDRLLHFDLQWQHSFVPGCLVQQALLEDPVLLLVFIDLALESELDALQRLLLLLLLLQVFDVVLQYFLRLLLPSAIV